MLYKHKQMGQIYVINSIATLAFRISKKKSLVTEQQLFTHVLTRIGEFLHCLAIAVYIQYLKFKGSYTIIA